MKKIGLVMGSGAARGVAHIGFVKALEENNIKPHCIAGCSAGAIVGACMALNMTADQMMQEVRKLKVGEVTGPVPNVAGAGLFTTKGVHRKLNSFFGRKRICELNTEYCCVATNLLSGEEKIFGGRTFLVPAVTASSCIPGFFEPEVIGGVKYIDGGLVSRVPIKAIRRFNPDVVIAVDVFELDKSEDAKYNSPITVLLRAIDIMDRKYTDMKAFEDNPDILIQPQLSGMSQYTFKNLEFAYEQGYKAGVENMEKIKELIYS